MKPGAGTDRVKRIGAVGGFGQYRLVTLLSEAGLELGRAVGAKVVARAQADGFDQSANVPIPTGPGQELKG